MNNQNKLSEKNEKKAGSLAGMMLQRDKNRIQNLNRNKNLEKLRKPRNQEYLRLQATVTKLSRELAELEKKIEKETERFTALQEGKKEKWWETTVPDKVPVKGTKEKKILEAESRLFKLKQRHQSLLEEFKYTMEKFIKEIPVPDKISGIIYPDYNEKILLKYGIISCPGEAFCTEQELIEHVKPDSKKVEEQWRKGFWEYYKYRDKDLLLTEIYMDMICVVLKNGETIVIE